MVFVVLGMPFALLGVLFTMDAVEHWVVRVAPSRKPVRSLVPEQRGPFGTNDPQVMVSQGLTRQSV